MAEDGSSLWQQIGGSKKVQIFGSINNVATTILLILAGGGAIYTAYKYVNEEFLTETVTIEIRLIGRSIQEGDQLSIYPLKRIEEISAEKHVSLVEDFDKIKGQNIKIKLISKNAPAQDLTSFYIGKDKNKILIICHQQEPKINHDELTIQ